MTGKTTYMIFILNVETKNFVNETIDKISSTIKYSDRQNNKLYYWLRISQGKNNMIIYKHAWYDYKWLFLKKVKRLLERIVCSSREIVEMQWPR